MKKYFLAATLIIAVFTTQGIQAQSFLEKMAKKAAEKAEQKAEQKTEEELDKKLDQLFEEAFENGDAESEGDVDASPKWAEKLAAMGYAGEPVDIEDSYSFTSSITMHIESIDKDGKTSSNGDIKIYNNADDQIFAYEFISNETRSNADQQKGLIIMDLKNKASIILNDDEKSGIVYGVDGLMDGSMYEGEEENEEEMPENIDNLNSRLTKTGNTKTILGYQCDEYKYKDEESKGLVYITQDVDWNSEDFMTTIFKSSMYSHGVFNGFMMASEHENLNDGEKSTYEVTDISKNDKSAFVMSDYQLTNIGSFKIPEGGENE